MVACCLCGIQIESNPSNMCSACLQARVDITEGKTSRASFRALAMEIANLGKSNF